MTCYPRGKDARSALRMQLASRILTEAKQTAAHMGWSMKCRGLADPKWRQLHAGTRKGCTNDGTSCLCPCHDQPDDDESVTA